MGTVVLRFVDETIVLSLHLGGQFALGVCMKKIEIVKCAIYLILSLSGMTMIKIGSSNGKRLFSILSVSVNVELIVGALCYGLSFLMFVFIISKIHIFYLL